TRPNRSSRRRGRLAEGPGATDLPLVDHLSLLPGRPHAQGAHHDVGAVRALPGQNRALSRVRGVAQRRDEVPRPAEPAAGARPFAEDLTAVVEGQTVQVQLREPNGDTDRVAPIVAAGCLDRALRRGDL